ncbi:MAG: NAD(P)-dependent oxidoreductase [Ilumatobacter fluminis]|uniref:NAD(P)-dependent oxidoreductase n=1 Tax=Ilumatobacter fluminis TaxID=467091 RepID=UPI0032EF1C49
MSRITVLGLGAMGSRMAANYSNAGHDVTVWNRTAASVDALADARAVTSAPSPSQAAVGADVVVSMVSDDDAAVAVWLGDDGALAAMRHDAIAVESSTLTPATVRRLAAAALARGVRFVEAPVVGSRPQADAGSLGYLLGGDQDTIDAVMPVIEINAGSAIRVGECGDAAIMKLAVNGLFAAQVAAYAEVVGVLERSSLDVDAVIATLSSLPITSPGLQRILRLIAEREFDPNFPIRLVAKDLGYLVDASGDLGAAVPMVEAARAAFERARDDDLGDLDIAGIASSYLG